jgi:hypothetical protein
MTLENIAALASLFGPPILAFLVFLRMGRPWLYALIGGLYVFAVCVMVLAGLAFLHEGLGLFGDGVGLALPFLVAACLWSLMARHFTRR